MRHWLWTYPEFNQLFMPYIAQKMREKEQQASSLILHDVSTRLSRIILEHINKELTNKFSIVHTTFQFEWDTKEK